MRYTKDDLKDMHEEINKKLDIVYNIDKKVIRIEEHIKNQNDKLKWCMDETESNSGFINKMKGALKLAFIFTTICVSIIGFALMIITG